MNRLLYTTFFVLSIMPICFTQADQVIQNPDGTLTVMPDVKPEVLTVEQARKKMNDDQKRLDTLRNEIASYEDQYSNLITDQEDLVNSDIQNFKSYVDAASVNAESINVQVIH